VKHHYARLIFILSAFLLSLVFLDFAKIHSNSQKVDSLSSKKSLTQAVEEIGKVLPGESATYYYKFYLKDSSAADNITTNNQTDSSMITGASVVVTNKSSFHCGENGSDYAFSEFGGLYKLICQEAGEMKLTISKSGYITKSTSISQYNGEIPIIYLTKAIAKTSTPLASAPETIKNVSLPPQFKEAGSETTDLSKISDVAKVEGFTIETKLGKIKFIESVDLSSAETKDKFKELDKYVKMDKAGVISLDSNNLPTLNKKANLTMKALPFIKTPRVLVDGKEKKEVVTNIQYKDGVLSFDVAHFSTFTVAPTVGINEPADNFETKDQKITLRGSTSDPTASVSAKLNGKDLGKLQVASDSGIFKKEIDLTEGKNVIVVEAISNLGIKATATVSGIFLKTSNKVPTYILLLILATIGAFGLLRSTKHLSKKFRKNSSIDQVESAKKEVKINQRS